MKIEKENLPLISVLIPTYNVEEFVEEAIRSIMNQTYRNLEIIVVDDCSGDNTFSILEELSGEDDRIKLFRNKENRKIVETLNFAFQNSTGEFIARMDGDDVSLINRLEEQFNYLSANKDIDLVGLNVIMINSDGEEIHKERYLEKPEEIAEASKYVSPVPHFWLTRRSLYEKIGNYRIPSAEDLDFLLRCIDANVKLANLPDFLYKQRIRNGNTATSLGLMQRKSIIYVRRLHLERKKTNSKIDSYSTDKLKNSLKTNNIENKLFKVSSFFHYYYIYFKPKNKLLAIFFMSIGIIFSPKYQITQVYNRHHYKRLFKDYRS